ncbi:MAG: hypothetical protein HUJ52_00340 [Malacoplasma sp.]|nr:hypothetical protein [Malacoplasma sp.]
MVKTEKTVTLLTILRKLDKLAENVDKNQAETNKRLDVLEKNQVEMKKDIKDLKVRVSRLENKVSYLEDHAVLK